MLYFANAQRSDVLQIVVVVVVPAAVLTVSNRIVSSAASSIPLRSLCFASSEKDLSVVVFSYFFSFCSSRLEARLGRTKFFENNAAENRDVIAFVNCAPRGVRRPLMSF